MGLLQCVHVGHVRFAQPADTPLCRRIKSRVVLAPQRYASIPIGVPSTEISAPGAASSISIATPMNRAGSTWAASVSVFVIFCRRIRSAFCEADRTSFCGFLVSVQSPHLDDSGAEDARLCRRQSLYPSMMRCTAALE